MDQFVHGFSLALEKKTKVVILIRRSIPIFRPISIGELTIESKPAIKYFGLMLDSKMSFFQPIKAAADRAAAGVAALSQLMVNIGATQSVLFCSAEVGTDALDKEVHRKRLAVIVIVGVIPVAVAIYRVRART